jgi:hypothetical protein
VKRLTAIVALPALLLIGTACAGDPLASSGGADDPWPTLTKAQEDEIFEAVDSRVTSCDQARQLFAAVVKSIPADDTEDAMGTAILMRQQKLCD